MQSLGPRFCRGVGGGVCSSAYSSVFLEFTDAHESLVFYDQPRMLPSMGRCVLQIAFTDRQDVGQIDQSLFVTAIRMDENIARMNLGVNCHTIRKRYP